MGEQSFSVSQLNYLIKDSINGCFPHLVWVTGEIQGFDRNKNKSHVFFELVEKDKGSHEIKAKIGLVIFAGKKAVIADTLRRSENAFVLKDDIEVKFACKVDFYPPHGAMRLIVESIDPVHTLGKVAQQRQKLIADLKKAGTLEKNKQLSLPRVPLKIGLVTSHDSAAYNDFVDEIEDSGLSFSIIVRNTLMQGAKTESDVCQAIDELQKIKGLDVIVITRGGGSIADLSWFDSKKIAEKIAVARVPVFSGIGHEINSTIVDLAGHTYAKTPTAIAQVLVDRVNIFLERLDELQERLVELTEDYFDRQRTRLKDRAERLKYGTQTFLKDHNEFLVKVRENLRLRPMAVLKQQRLAVALLTRGVKKNALDFTQDTRRRLRNIEKVMQAYSLEKTLKRGFSITRSKDGKVVRETKAVKKGDELRTQVAVGEIISEVK